MTTYPCALSFITGRLIESLCAITEFVNLAIWYAICEEREKTMKRIVMISVMALLPLLAACHTVQGAGKDISAVGHGVSDAASH